MDNPDPSITCLNEMHESFHRLTSIQDALEALAYNFGCTGNSTMCDQLQRLSEEIRDAKELQERSLSDKCNQEMKESQELNNLLFDAAMKVHKINP